MLWWLLRNASLTGNIPMDDAIAAQLGWHGGRVRPVQGAAFVCSVPSQTEVFQLRLVAGTQVQCSTPAQPTATWC